MSKALALYAGPKALAHIKEHGLNQEQVKLVVGASGGPKWFALAGLDRYLCGEYFKQRSTQLDTLGSSAGGWRFSCYAQNDPLAAINRLIDGYSHLSYPQNANIEQVTMQSEQLLAHVLGNNGASEVVDNPLVKNNIIVAKSKGFTRYEQKTLQILGLVKSAFANRRDRKNLGKYYQRVIFSADTNNVPFDFNDGIDSKVVALTNNNVSSALQSTGAIPLIINGVKDIEGAGQGMYRDGGIIDYHFDQPFLPNSDDGLVLYPHFHSEFKPGWFDKYISNRFSNPAHFDNVLVLAPTSEFVASLPYQKIPDRKDFQNLTEEQRISYWKTVIKASEQLANEFDAIVHSNEPWHHILPIS